MIRTGTNVKWKEGNTSYTGTVEESFNEQVVVNTSGIPVKRSGTENNKVLLILTDDGILKNKMEKEVKRDNQQEA